MGVDQLGVVLVQMTLVLVQMGVVQLGVVQLGVVQTGVDLQYKCTMMQLMLMDVNMIAQHIPKNSYKKTPCSSLLSVWRKKALPAFQGRSRHNISRTKAKFFKQDSRSSSRLQQWR